MRWLIHSIFLLCFLQSLNAQESQIEKLFSDTVNNADVQANIGIAFYQTKTFDSAIVHLLNALPYYDKQKDLEKIAVISKITGVCYATSGQHKLALGYFQDAISYYKTHYDTLSESTLANLYGNLGMSYRALSEYKLSSDNLFLALEIFEKKNDKKNIANTYNHLGNVFRDWKNMNKAEEYYSQANEIGKQLNNIGLQASSLNNLAIIARERKDFKKAIELYSQSILLKEKQGNKKGIASSMLGLGIAYKSLGQYNRALEYYLKTLSIDIEVGDKSGEGAVLSNIGLLYMTMGNYTKAIEYLNESNVIAEQIGYLELQKNNQEAIAEAYELMGDYRKAFFANKIHHQLQDSIFSIEELKQINELENQYNIEKKKQEIAILAIENELKEARVQSQNRTLWILASMLCLLSISLLIILYQLTARNKAYKLLVKKSVEISLNESLKQGNRQIRQISDEKMQGLILQLEDYFKKEKPYLNPEFQLQDCCRELNTNSKYLSEAINEIYQMSFTSLVNELRIKEASLILSAEESKNYTLEAIAQQVGFNSKSAFNAAFKRYMGVTPSFYIQHLQQIPFPN